MLERVRRHAAKKRWPPVVAAAVCAAAFLGATAGCGADAARRPAKLRVYAVMALEETYPGGFNEVETGMENITTNRHVVAWITTTILYKDRPRDQVMRWRAPHKLDPGYGFGAFILFAIPKDAPIGTATARTVVRIVRAVPLEGRSESEREFERIVATDTFEVVRKRDCATCPSEMTTRRPGVVARTYRLP